MTSWQTFKIPSKVDQTETTPFAEFTERDGMWFFQIDGEVSPLPNVKKFTPLFEEQELIVEGIGWLLASPPERYLASVAASKVVVDNMTCGEYELSWYASDSRISTIDRTCDGGEEVFSAPAEATYLFLRRTSR